MYSCLQTSHYQLSCISAAHWTTLRSMFRSSPWHCWRNKAVLRLDVWTTLRSMFRLSPWRCWRNQAVLRLDVWTTLRSMFRSSPWRCWRNKAVLRLDVCLSSITSIRTYVFLSIHKFFWQVTNYRTISKFFSGRIFDNCPCMYVFIYRMVYTECSPTVCPCGDKCSNQRIQKHESSVKFEKFLTQNRGYGVKTVDAISSGMSVSHSVAMILMCIRLQFVHLILLQTISSDETSDVSQASSVTSMCDLLSMAGCTVWFKKIW